MTEIEAIGSRHSVRSYADKEIPQEIADRLHFSSSQHFSLAFKRSVGVSPEAYRKAFLAKQKNAEE